MCFVVIVKFDLYIPSSPKVLPSQTLPTPTPHLLFFTQKAKAFFAPKERRYTYAHEY